MAQKPSGTELLKQQTGVAPIPAKDAGKQTFASALEAMKPEFAKVLPKSITADRLIRIALTEVRKNPTLAQCELQSTIGSIMVGAQLALEPGVMGQAYLVPFNQAFKDQGQWKKKMVCTFIPGWQGYVDLVSRSGRASCWTGAVYEGDEFDASLGSKPFVHHIPDWNAGEGRKLLYTYSVGRQKGSTEPVVDVWGMAKVLAHRARYNKVGDKHYSYKDENNFEMYARKLPLLQVVKYLPKSVELQMASSLDISADTGTQMLNIHTASAGYIDAEAPEALPQPSETSEEHGGEKADFDFNYQPVAE
jgi:recombination protein RecT